MGTAGKPLPLPSLLLKQLYNVNHYSLDTSRMPFKKQLIFIDTIAYINCNLFHIQPKIHPGIYSLFVTLFTYANGGLEREVLAQGSQYHALASQQSTFGGNFVK